VIPKNIVDLIIVLTQKEMKIRYKSSVLGYVWSVLQPLAFAFVFVIAFKIVMRMGMENYAIFLIAGLFPWQCLSNSVTVAPIVFIGNASIIKKVNFPRNITLMATIFQDMIHLILSIPVIIFFLLIYDMSPHFSWFYGMPILIVIQLLTTYGIAIIISTLNLFFRDLERLTTIIMTFMFYFTPILYSVDMIPEKYLHLVNLNPLAPLIISWRQLILHGKLDIETLGISLLYGLAAAALGHLIYRKLSWKFAEIL
jgi:lipopolysaccharide transport system permease protein